MATAPPLTMKPADARQPLAPRGDVPGVRNFAQISAALYRGAQPTARGFAELKQLGIRTVVNLRFLHDDRSKLRGTGLRYLHLPCNAWRPKVDHVLECLKVVLSPHHQPVFIHCLHGADRTGTMAAIYRMIEHGWTPDEAVCEIRNFGFHPIFTKIIPFLNRFDATTTRERLQAVALPTIEIVE